VIAREKFAHKVRASGLTAIALVQDYERLADIVDPQPLAEPACRDPDDDHVLACALAAQATLIVSRDKDLLDLHPYHGIAILPSAAALQRLEPKTAS
jgi:putative PIN family toxin of toxin-antitoxin system